MNETQVLEQVFLGEDSRNQFKAAVESPDSLAAELCAFGNTDGGRYSLASMITERSAAFRIRTLPGSISWFPT